ncbi:hypothetical protein, partial [Dolichospermum sp. UHCC 0352]|uniref:hypothetical protein n=1 Tax=Dolichospermum sp. UHCC 0352 TaxID=2590011 RepID=UPI001C2B8043
EFMVKALSSHPRNLTKVLSKPSKISCIESVGCFGLCLPIPTHSWMGNLYLEKVCNYHVSI